MAARPIQRPVFINGNNLGIIREGDNQLIPVTAYDPDPFTGQNIQYSITTGSAVTEQLPPTMKLDTGSGYIYGFVSTQTSFLKKYSLQISAKKQDILQTSSYVTKNFFNLLVKNSDPTIITWNNFGFLGTLTQGAISDLGILATSNIPKDILQYRVVGSSSDLPPGLTLNTSGNIVGTVTTSGIFTATVVASTSSYINDPWMFGPDYPNPFSTQTITIQVLSQPIPITNIYANPFLKLESRQRYLNFINSSSIFVPEMIYRADDPNFGIQKKIKMNLEFGIQKLNLADYYPALLENFYRRPLNFGNVRVARAINNLGVHLYDVVYVDIKDDIENAPQSITINSSTYFPASIDNMRYKLENLQAEGGTIGINRNNFPKFMNTAQQGDYLPLGYVKVVILCYTLPTFGDRILARINLSKFDFKTIHFEIDRLTIENTLDNTSNKYLLFNKQNIRDTENSTNVLYDGSFTWNFDDGTIITFE